MALFGPGDEVITHMPGWPTIVEQIKLAGAATPVIVRTRIEDGFALHADALLAAVTPRTRAHRHQLAGQSDRRAAVAKPRRGSLAPRPRRRDLWVVIDLCYEGLIYDGVPHNLPKIFGDAMRDRLVLADRRRRRTR